MFITETRSNTIDILSMEINLLLLWTGIICSQYPYYEAELNCFMN